MKLLGEKLGSLLLQFPYLNQEVMPIAAEFLVRLARYLGREPRTHRYAVEVRNRKWLAQPLLDLSCSRGVALAQVDQGWIATITRLAEKLDMLPAEFTYIRWIDDRKWVEEQTKTSDKIIINRERETQTWVRYVRQFLHRGEIVYAYTRATAQALSRCLESCGAMRADVAPVDHSARNSQVYAVYFACDSSTRTFATNLFP